VQELAPANRQQAVGLQRNKNNMAILDPLYGTPLAVQLIPQVDRNFAEHLKLRDDQRSIGLLSVDNDDATYTAID